ncbi:hypothetical protein F4692_000739 [Nocardioides cavernae]|uniref:Toxin-antitoxin system HicB family antitoxin n=1 Tax=Nocardioides cavernae TaxID=1921566 RepID=A0A7Y9KQI6_9ACTN|nr:hypothetical protein [Nocardioides cavernae]NYE35635.1 hypothetical protein [Nocardioides cavernae]
MDEQAGDSAPKRGAERKSVLLRLDPAVHSALQRWAADELRSVNAQIELLLRDALRDAGRAPRDAGPVPRRGRPPKERDD